MDQHGNHESEGLITRSCFRVGQSVEDLVDVVRIWAFDFDWVRGQFSIEVESALEMVVNELRVDLPLRENPESC